MYHSIILPIAKADIQDSSTWYEAQQKGLGKTFILFIRESIQFITANPYSFQVRFDEIRTAVVKKFPFLIHYLIDENSKTVIIVAVFHTSRDPLKWNDRNKSHQIDDPTS
jgi:plasmid stabilization system protein ParE